jgi:hypothetical protein
LNGPVTPAEAAKTSHVLTNKNTADRPIFLEAATPRYPRMANFSFYYGNSHWAAIDANTYMDWSNRLCRSG